MPFPTLAHQGDDIVSAKFSDNGVCDHCKSMTVELAMFYLTQPGTKFAGDDWRKGYPEKFYITPFDPIKGHRTFRVIHLMDASDEQLHRFSEISREVFGIMWFRDGNGIRFNSPRSSGLHGFQRHGIIGPEGKPIHQDGMNSDQIFRILDASEEKIQEKLSNGECMELRQF